MKSEQLDVPEEILLSAHLTAEGLVERAKLEAALALYREGGVSSGLAATWVSLPQMGGQTMIAAC